MSVQILEKLDTQLPRTHDRIISDHFNLQNKVLSTLPANQNWLHVRTEEEWDEVLISKDKKIIGVHDDSGNLVAHSVALLPNKDNPDADMLNMRLPALPEQLTTLTSVISDPECRGMGLMNKMLMKWKSVALERERPHLLALITTDNVASWTQFMNIGLEIVGADFDPSDGSNVYYAHGDLEKEYTKADFSAFETMILCPECPLDEMQDIFRQGWVGYAPERSVSGEYTGNLMLKLQKG